MKTLVTFIILLFGAFASFAQSAENYALLPGYTATLSPGQKMELSIQWTDPHGKNNIGGADLNPLWQVNGHSLAQLESSDGDISNSLIMAKIVYTAPATVPKKNPVIVTVTFHPTGKIDEKAIVILQCAITIADAYK